jgi:prepilin-type N-terminal cleavage/methylation domain-containing protein
MLGPAGTPLVKGAFPSCRRSALMPTSSNRPRSLSPAAGVTLLEILLALAIAAVALAAIYGFIISTTRSFGLAEGVIETQQTVRFIADRITEEARWAEEVAPDGRCPPTLLCSDRVTLRIPGANPVRPGMSYEVTFAYDARGGTALRRHERIEQVIGERVGALQFRYLTADGQPALSPGAVVRVALSVTAASASGNPKRSIQTDFLLRNLRPEGAEPPSAPPIPPPAYRPAPSPPAGLGPVGRAPAATPRAEASPPVAAPAASPTAASPGQPACPPAPEAQIRRPPPRPEIRGALVDLSDWEITRTPSGALRIEADANNNESHPALGVRISATGYGLGGSVVASGSAVVPEIGGADFESFQITLPPSQPVLWIILKVEQYLPRPTAPLFATLAQVDLDLYREVAKERVVAAATIVPSGPAARSLACVLIADPGGLPVASARVTVEVAAVGQRTQSATVDVSAGKVVSIPLTWTARVLPGVAVKVEEVRLAP